MSSASCIAPGAQSPPGRPEGTRTALLADKGDEHLMVAVGAANSGKTVFQIAALEKGSHGAVDNRSTEAVLGLI